jgi:hypothetical protein
MKKSLFCIVVCLFVFVGTVYGGAKYDDVKPVIEKLTKVFEKLFIGLEKAGSADEVAAALDYAAKEMKTIVPKIKEFEKKYPELKNEKTHPEELKPMLKKFDDLVKRMIGVYAKIAQYANDPKVQEARKRFEKTMTVMDDNEVSEAEKEQ